MAHAAGDSHEQAFYGGHLRVTFPILDADGDLVTGAAALDSEVSIDGGTFADCTNEATEIATASGMYYLDLTGAEMTGKQITVIVKTSTSGAKTTPITIYPKRLKSIASGTAQAGGASTITLAASTIVKDGALDGCFVLITNNGAAGSQYQLRRIISSISSTQVATVDSAWGTNPSVASTYDILASDTVNLAGWGGLALASINTNGLPDVNTTKLSGTTQTARDIGASVLLSTGTGAGQLDFTSGIVKANLTQILGTLLTETAGLLAGGFKKFFNVAAPTGTLNSIPDAVAGAAGGLRIAGTNAAVTENITGNITGNLSGSVGSVTGNVGGNVVGTVASVVGAVGSVSGAVGSVTGNVGGNVVGTVASVVGAVGSVTGLTASNLDTSISSRASQTSLDTVDDFIDTEVAAIKAKTDQLTFTSANKVDSNVVEMAANIITSSVIATDALGSLELATSAVDEIVDAVWDEARAGHVVAGSFGQGVASVQGSITGSVASVTGNVGGSVASLTTNNDKIGYRLSATGVDDILDEVVEGTYSVRQYLRGFAASLLGKLSGAATATVTIRDTGDTKDRVVASVDANGNRSAVTLDVT